MAINPTVKLKKNATNEDMLKALIKEVGGGPLGALLRERIVKIMEITAADIEKNPEPYNNAFVGAGAYLKLKEYVDHYIGFND